MPLWLYALTAVPLPEGAPHGAAGEPLAAWPIPPLAATEGAGEGTAGQGSSRAGPALFAVAGEVAAPLPPGEASLRRHDRTVRALAAALDPLLPVRFGQTVAAAGDLVPLLAPRRAVLLAALARVAGCVQITLRFPPPAGGGAESAGDGEPAGPAAAATAGPGSAEGDEPQAAAGAGTRYLLARRQSAAVAPPAHAATLLARLAPLVRGERVAGPRPPHAATVYHLVERRRLDDYLAALAEAAAGVDPPPLASGPWPAWSFAPGLVE